MFNDSYPMPDYPLGPGMVINDNKKKPKGVISVYWFDLGEIRLHYITDMDIIS